MASRVREILRRVGPRRNLRSQQPGKNEQKQDAPRQRQRLLIYGYEKFSLGLSQGMLVNPQGVATFASVQYYIMYMW